MLIFEDSPLIACPFWASAVAVCQSTLFPESISDTEEPLPEGHLDHLRHAGLTHHLPLIPSDFTVMTRFVLSELIAYTCLDTWFVLTQHWSASALLNGSAMTDVKLFQPCKGLIGVGYGHLRRQTACLTVNYDDQSVSVKGFAPWVTGSGWLESVVYGATDPEGMHCYIVVPHANTPSYHIEDVQRLSAVKRTDTRRVSMDVSLPISHLIKKSPSYSINHGDDMALLASTAPILGLIQRVLDDWAVDVDFDTKSPYLKWQVHADTLRSDIYNALMCIDLSSLMQRQSLRRRAHTLLEVVIDTWAVVIGGRGNDVLHRTHRRRVEASFFRVFQQTSYLRAAAVSDLENHYLSVL